MAEASREPTAGIIANGSPNVDHVLLQLERRQTQLSHQRSRIWRRLAVLLRSLLRAPLDADPAGLDPATLNSQAARLQIASLERRAAGLEDELRLRYADLLELQALIVRPTKGGGRAPLDVSEDVSELHEIFRDIATRTRGTPSQVTVVIPVYGKLEYTVRCLKAIGTTWSASVNPMIVVVDDASPDGSVHDLIGIPRIDIVRNGKNMGFLHSSNRGAALAQTPYTCFLNNDTEVLPGWLDALVSTLKTDDTIGAVGSKLIYPNGTLQEAGSIIWSDASGWNVGRGDDPTKSEYNYLRDVDYCSAASLLVRTDLLRSIGGFDDRYAPAYYEDVDLCFEIRARGFRVVYDSRSELIHYEGVSSGTDVSSGVKHYQEVNRPKFAEKWAPILAAHLRPSADNVATAIRRERGLTVLIIDSYVPMYDREAGSNRLFKVIQILRELDYHVIFLPDNYAALEPYTTALFGLGVEVLHTRPHGPSREEALIAALRRIDVAWICRPELCEVYIPVVRRESKAPILYDTIDLHFERERARVELTGGDDLVWQKMKALELSMAREADMVITVTEAERQTLGKYGIMNVAVVPTIHDTEVHRHLNFALRSGIVFIGGYNHTPNVDAAIWLCEVIMPLVWRTHPRISVTLLGSNPPGSVSALRSDLVSVPGYVADVAPYFEEHRLFVAPLRYGAGMKGKIGHALSFDLPLVTTNVGVDGYELADGRNCLIADDAEAFAKAIVLLYSDETLWERFAAAGSDVVKQLGREPVRQRILALFEEIGVLLPNSMAGK